MKRFILSIVALTTTTLMASAMSYEKAKEEALYLTDKMSYELNLNDQQYNDAYEINLDYFMSLKTEDEIEGEYWRNRYEDLRCIMYDWQWNVFTSASYFLTPVVWNAGWVFPIYGYYAPGFFYYSCPVVCGTYMGCHCRTYFAGGYYCNRRPVWTCGMRGSFRGSARNEHALRGGSGRSVRSGSNTGYSGRGSSREYSSNSSRGNYGGNVSSSRGNYGGSTTSRMNSNRSDDDMYSTRGSRNFSNSSSRTYGSESTSRSYSNSSSNSYGSRSSAGSSSYGSRSSMGGSSTTSRSSSGNSRYYGGTSRTYGSNYGSSGTYSGSPRSMSGSSSSYGSSRSMGSSSFSGGGRSMGGGSFGGGGRSMGGGSFSGGGRSMGGGGGRGR